MNTQLSLKTALLALCGLLLLGAGPTSPSLPVTAAFITAGGGAGSFSMVRAFDTMIGNDALQSELQTLRDKYGNHDVDRFVHQMDFAISDGWERAGQDDVKIPAASSDTGKDLLRDMIKAGTTSSGRFQMSKMMDALLTARVHGQVASDLSARYGQDAVANLERIGTQFFSDLAQS